MDKTDARYPSTIPDGVQSNSVQWNDLPDTCKVDRSVAVAAIHNFHLQRWNDVPNQLQNDEEVAFAAWKRFLRWNERYFSNLQLHAPCLNQAFFRKCMEEGMLEEWNDLPSEFRNDIAFARSISRFPSKYLVLSILDGFPILCEERDSWIKLMDVCPDYLGDLLALYAPVDILMDRSLMVVASRLPRVLENVDDTLGLDRSFLEEVLDQNPLQLASLSLDVQILFPDLVLQHLPLWSQHPELSRRNIDGLLSWLDRSFWGDRLFLETWIRLGLPVHHWMLPDPWDSDRGLFLLVAAHSRADYRSDSFSNASPALRADKNFMLQVLEHDAQLIFCTSQEVQRDFDIAVFVFAKSLVAFADIYPVEFTRQLDLKMKEKLFVHELFFKTILCGIWQSADNSPCALPLLSQGSETTMSYKRAIAEFLGIPTGRELRLLRRASEYLSRS